MLESKIQELLNQVQEVTDTPIDFSSLKKEDYPELVLALCNAGHKKSHVAALLNISRRTVYNYLNKARDSVKEELENVKYIDIFVEQLSILEDRRDSLLRDANLISVAGKRNTYDEDGNLIKKTGSTRDYTEVMRLVRDYDKMIIDLKKSVGMIPVNQPDNIYSNMRDRNPDNKEVSESEVLEMNSEELQKQLLKKLQHKAPPLQQETKLKQLKDEKVL